METEAEQTENRDTSNYDALLRRAGELERWHGIRVDRRPAHSDHSGRGQGGFRKIRPLNGFKPRHCLSLKTVPYDKTGRVVLRKKAYPSQHYGFGDVKTRFYGLTPEKMSEIGKIKVHTAQ